MRSEQEIFDLIMTFAHGDDNIRAVVMNGSRTNPNAPKDLFQDFDIACLINDLTPYIHKDKIPAYFGDILILQEPDNMGEPFSIDKGYYAYLMQFMDGNRIDLSFHAPERWKTVTSDSLSILLLDKDNVIGELPPSNDGDYLPVPPTEKQFQDCCNEFWWVTPYAAKGLWRGELTYAKHIQDEYIREQLMKMLVWYFGIKTDFKKSPGKLGKYLKHDIEPELWAELEQTYSDGDFAHIWESLFTMGNLFRQLAKHVAANFGFQYPQQDDDNVSKFIRRIKDLPADATTF